MLRLYLEGLHYFSEDDYIDNQIDIICPELDRDGLIELKIFDMANGFNPHLPALMDLYHWRGNKFVKVNEQFGEAYRPLESVFLQCAISGDQYHHPTYKYGITYICYVAEFRDLIGEAQAPTWSGSINGSWPIKMALTFSNGEVYGTYFYDKYKKNIALLGKIDEKQNIVMTEYDKDGNITGAFHGKIIANQIVGAWVNADSTISYPFR